MLHWQATGRAPSLWQGMRPYARQVAGLLAIGSACGVLMNTAVVLPPILLGHAVDVVLAHDRGEVGGDAVTGAVLLLVAGTLATEIPRIGKRYWLGVCRNRIKANVRADAVRGVLSWPAERLHRTSVGEIMGRVVGLAAVVGEHDIDRVPEQHRRQHHRGVHQHAAQRADPE